MGVINHKQATMTSIRAEKGPPMDKTQLTIKVVNPNSPKRE